MSFSADKLSIKPIAAIPINFPAASRTAPDVWLRNPCSQVRRPANHSAWNLMETQGKGTSELNPGRLPPPSKSSHISESGTYAWLLKAACSRASIAAS